ncbi:MAG: bifunctional phosphopantothenoylcysteine decarboxylase/phosphopantothenate--cysteine ligase CoaBC [Muribaculaceae bacterium]|nr:bifunctional phosphopantothenoylcysteine decarboxylase/phosphopantothenate--cysteine ligase CoaBC [Muribaculaceae bacterium]
MLKGKNIILGISGGIAAYKSVVLLRQLVKGGAQVQVVMTPNAREFIQPVTLSSLSQRPVVTEFFSANTGEWHSHVSLGEWADAMIVAPATASTLAKMANGVADNMLVTTYLSARCPVFVAPAMDLDMMAHPTTTRNLATLAADGVHIIEPETGELASGLSGRGRMEEPEKIAAVLDAFFAADGPLAGKKVLITAGPTYERIDPVRFIGNFSTGKMGYAIAEEAASRGAEVTLVSGPTALSVSSPRIRRIDVESAREMLEASQEAFENADIAIMTAAVADYAPAHVFDSKIKREKAEFDNIELVKNPDIAATLGRAKRPGQILVGFALETDHAMANGRDKLERKNLDMIVVNSLADKGAGFGTDTNKISIISAGSDTPADYPLKSKKAVAADILDFIATL